VDAQRPRVAVLPFVLSEGGGEDEYLADGMAEQTIAMLSKIAGLDVIARSSTIRFKRTPRDITAIGRELGVRAVLEGGIRTTPGHVVVTASLIDVRTRSAYWSEAIDRPPGQVQEVPPAIAQRVAETLKVRLSDDERRRIAAGRPTSPDAHALYLRGRASWNLRTRDGFRKAIEFFEQAIERDPSDAAAHAGLADSYGFLGLYGYLPSKDAFPKAAAAAQKAIELDESRADAHTALGAARLRYDWDWAEAERELRRAVGLEPSYAPAHETLSACLVATKRFDEGIAEMERALALDPLSLTLRTLLGWTFYYARQYDHAVEQHRKALDLEPRLSLARWGLGVAYALQGTYDQAVQELSLVTDSRPDVAGDLAYVYGRWGRTREARQALASLETRARQGYASPLAFASAYIGLGDVNRAFQWLDRAYAERNSDLIWLAVDPYYDLLRPDPRFTALVKKMGLEK
jgi:TolB-like protein/Flp pilus assembly protein TadD